jgi:hypothetical protein
VNSQRIVVLSAGFLLAIGFGLPALAGVPPQTCDATIEINAFRGGSPTVSVGSVKNVTAKARLQKGTGPADQTLNNTTVTIDAMDASGVVDSQSASGVTLVVGKGGQGAKLGLNISRCDGGSIDFFATFTGTSSTNGEECTATTERPLTKTCN